MVGFLGFQPGNVGGSFLNLSIQAFDGLFIGFLDALQFSSSVFFFLQSLQSFIQTLLERIFQIGDLHEFLFSYNQTLRLLSEFSHHLLLLLESFSQLLLSLSSGFSIGFSLFFGSCKFFFLLLHLILSTSDTEQRLYLDVQFPPRPVPQEQVLPDVPLQDSNTNSSVAHFLVLNTHEMTFAVSLELRDDLGQTFVTHVFQFSHNTGTEEDLGQTNSVFGLVKLKSFNQLLCGNFTVDESLGDGGSSQDLVSLFEICEHHP